MICHSCRTPDHSGCPGGDRCDCQHIGHPEAPPVLDVAGRLARMLAPPTSDPPTIKITSKWGRP
jgi:hypothetical protein